MSWGSFVSGVASAVGSAISGACSAIGGAIGGALSGICGALGSALAGTSIGQGIAALSAGIASIAGALGLPPVAVAAAIVAIVCVVANALGVKEEGKDDPDELGMKAEKADKKPEDFDSTEEYLEYLHNEIELTDEEKERLKNMSPEEKAAYQTVGCAIYMDAIKEKLELDSPVSVPFLYDAKKLDMDPKVVIAFIKNLSGAGLTTEDMSKFLHGESTSLDNRMDTMDAIISTLKEMTPGISDSEIDAKLEKMIEGVK